MVLIIVSLLKPMEILSEYRETSVTFLGTVYGKEGNRLAGVSVCLEHRPDSVQLTDSEGKYVIMVKSTELPFNYITLCFEHPQFIRITRRFVWKGDFQVYHEIIFQKGG